MHINWITSRIYRARRLAAALVLPGMLLAGTAQAAVVSGSSSGYGISVDLSALAGALSLSAGPLPNGAVGSAPAPYSVSDSVLSLSLLDSVCVTSLPIVGCTLYVSAGVTTGLLTGDAASDVDGGSGSRFASATGTVDDAGVNAGTGTLLNLFGTLGLGLTATTLSSSAMVGGDYGGFTPTGSSIIEDANLNVASVGLIALDPNAAPNTVVDPLGALSLLGLTVILNEQISNCSAASCDMAVNALRIGFDNFAVGTALLNGDIIFGHSEAMLAAEATVVPVPAALWLFGSGLLTLVGLSRCGMRKS
ncbi:MAG TPA: hypothetical protein VIR60_07200 [Gammaproteobacteria bacterium]